MFVLSSYCMYIVQSRECVVDSQNQESYECQSNLAKTACAVNLEIMTDCTISVDFFVLFCMLRLSLATQLSEKAHEHSDNTIVIAFVR